MFNIHLSQMRPSASMQNGLEEHTQPVTNLAMGSPDIKAPVEVINIIKAGAEELYLGYIPAKGTVKALSNLKKIAFRNEDNVNPEQNLLLVNGAKYGIYITLKTVCNYGDNILLMQPYWLSYPEIAISLGLNFHSWYPVHLNTNIAYDLNVFEQLVRTHRIKALILNNPNNPSGQIFSKKWISEINEILKKYDAYLIIDEVYKELVFDRSRLTEFCVTDINIIRVGSLSKSLCIPGLRLGYIYGSKELICNANLFNQHIVTCINSLSCYLMEHLDEATFHSFSENCAVIYENRFKTISSLLKNTNLKILHSEASFYSLIDFGYYFKDGEETCRFLSSNLSIKTVSGIEYGDYFKSYIRVCLTLPVVSLLEKINDIINILK